MTSDSGDDEDAALRARLKKLSGDLKARTPQPPPAPAPAPSRSNDTGSAMSLAMRAGSEFISAILVGAAIGWGLDKLLHTNPAFLIVFFMLGVAAGVWNVIRLTSPKGVASGHNSPLSPAKAADKDVRRSAPGAEQTGPNVADDDED